MRSRLSGLMCGRTAFGTRFFSAAIETVENSITPTPTLKKRLDVAIVGAPNAGKSQLLNALAKSSVAAVSRKRHTTRTDILGARTIGDTQIVFKDTPGYLRVENAKEERLDRELLVNAASEMQHVDYTLLVVDAARNMTDNYRHALVQLMMFALQSQGRIEEDYNEGDDEKSSDSTLEASAPLESKFAVVLNKVDLVKPKSGLIDLAMDIGSMADMCIVDTMKQQSGITEESGENTEFELDFETLMKVSPVNFYVSALEEDGIEDIVEHLVQLATPCRVWPVPAGEATDMSPEEQVEELIREKLYRCLHQEVPHSVKQVNRLFRKVPQGVIIHQDLVVFNKSHHKLVLGSGGKTLQRIQDSATKDLKNLFGCEVMLQLHVKVSKSKQRRSAEDHVASVSTQTMS